MDVQTSAADTTPGFENTGPLSNTTGRYDGTRLGCDCHDSHACCYGGGAAPRLKRFSGFVFILPQGRSCQRASFAGGCLRSWTCCICFSVISWEKTLPSMTAVILYLPSTSCPLASFSFSLPISPTWYHVHVRHFLPFLALRFSKGLSITWASPRKVDLCLLSDIIEVVSYPVLGEILAFCSLM